MKKNVFNFKVINLEKKFGLVLIAYFCILVLPYCFAPIGQAYSFFTNSIVNIFLRFISSIFIFIYFLLIFIKYRPKIDKIYVSLSFLMIILLVISLLYTNSTFESIITHEPYLYLTHVSYQIGAIELFSGFFSCLIDLLFGYAFLFLFPLICNKDSTKKFFIFIIFFVIFEIFYSLFFEAHKYINTITGNSSFGGYDINICATFISKNQFGAFLIMGFVSSWILLIMYANSKFSKIFYSLCCFLIALISIFSLCKTAIMSLILFSIVYFIYFIFKSAKKRRYKSLISLLIITLFILIFILLLEVTSLHNINGFKQLHTLFSILLKKAFGIAFQERIVTWFYSLRVLRGGHLIFGYPKATVYYVLGIGTNGNNMYAHNGFIQQMLYYGITGVLILFYSYFLLFKRIHYLRSKSEKVLFISIFLSIFAFMMTETEILIVSSSLLVFVFNIVFVLCSSNCVSGTWRDYEIKI